MAYHAKIYFSIMTLIASSSLVINGAPNHQMVVYWGQNQLNTVPLDFFCTSLNYNKIVLSFLNVFFDRGNRQRLPGLNFVTGCTGPFQGYSSLLQCPGIETGIGLCQANGIKVTLSVGGAIGDYDLTSRRKAKEFAKRLWHLFLGGGIAKWPRPFGSAVLDGIDMNIEKGSSTYYSDFVQELHNYMQGDNSKDYIITTPPGCPFPDAYLGPGGNTALENHGEKFTDIYVQFYCCGCDPGNALFYERFYSWANFTKDVRDSNQGNGPKVYMGLPAHPDASGIPGGEIFHKTVAEIQVIYNTVKDNPSFGGIMMWNAGFDDLNRLSDGRTYGEHLIDMLD